MIHSNRFAFAHIDNGLAIADQLSNSITLLNSSAAIVWLSLSSAAMTLAEIQAEIKLFWPNDFEGIHKDVDALLANWRNLGWIKSDATEKWALTDLQDVSNSQAVTSLQPPCQSTVMLEDDRFWSRTIFLSTTPLTLEFKGDQSAATLEDSTRMAGFFSGLPKSQAETSAETLSIIFEPNRVTLKSKESLRVFPDMFAASSVLSLSAIKLAYPAVCAHTVIHAASVTGPQGAIILPAISGSGKTTLTAYLVAKGWFYGGDDIIGLGRSSPIGRITLLPFPTAMGIKEGSVDILRQDYANLTSTSVVNYACKKVRYHAVDAALLTPDQENFRTPRAIVFPTYDKTGTCELVALSEWEALARLLEAGTGTGTGTDLESFELLVELVKTVPRFSLRYSSLDDAKNQLEKIMNSPSQTGSEQVASL